MSAGSQLLRMLEPAVRPAGLPGPVARPISKPIESQSFETLLDQARQTESPQAANESDPKAAANEQSTVPPEAKAALPEGFNIENASLLKLMTHNSHAATMARSA